MRQNREIVALSIDYDGCGDVLSDYVPPTLVESNDQWPRVVPFMSLTKVTPSHHKNLKRRQFWKVVWNACGRRKPDVCMSGSARIVYQRPMVREQDGIAHAVVLNDALVRQGYPGIEASAFQRRDGGTLTISHKKIPWPDEDEVVRTKMSIVCEQIAYLSRSYPDASITFVFVDDIYSTRLAKAIRRHTQSLFISPHVNLHLVHYESFDLKTSASSKSIPVQENVFYWPKGT